MAMQALREVARTLVAGDKGLLAMDESVPTLHKRFAKLGIPQTEEARRAYRELLATTPGLSDSISGAILFDETMRQTTKAGAPIVKVLADAGIIPGVKVDAGAKDLAGHPLEKVSEGLDGLRDRLKAYVQLGARFAKWRAVIAIGETIPSRACVEANAHALARYAALCQEAGLVPVVEPEALMDGDHTLDRCRQTTETVLRCVFDQLAVQGVTLEAMILKPNMIVPGLACAKQETVEEVADATVESSLAGGPRGGSGDRVPVGRPIERTRLRPAQRDERQVQGSGAARALGAGVFLRPRDSAARLGYLGRQGGQRGGGAEILSPSRRVQSGRAARRIRCVDGSVGGLTRGRLAAPPKIVSRVSTTRSIAAIRSPSAAMEFRSDYVRKTHHLHRRNAARPGGTPWPISWSRAIMSSTST